MSHFYASIDGQAQTGATRCGSRQSGISGHVRGWHNGARVCGGIERDGERKEHDVFNVYATGGSGYGKSDLLIARIVDGKVYVRHPKDSRLLEVKS